MRRKILFAAAVLGATIFWANCDVVFRLERPPPPNQFFVGCFAGITDPPDGKDLEIVLEAGSSGPRALKGCLRFSSAEIAILAGNTEEYNREQARITAMPLAPSTILPFTIVVEREPAGNSAATTINVTNEEGVPFQSAPDLAPCALSCADFGVVVPFMPDGGPP